MSHLKLGELVARVAESKLGIRESGGPNKGKDLQQFFDADDYDPNGAKPGDDGYPWCAAFVCLCVKEAMHGGTYTFKRPTTASAFGLEAWSLAQDNSTWTRKPPARDIQRGDIVVFEFSHCGIATSDIDEQGYFVTVEGNTNQAGSREGDGVYRKSRHISKVRSRIRFRV